MRPAFSAALLSANATSASLHDLLERHLTCNRGYLATISTTSSRRRLSVLPARMRSECYGGRRRSTSSAHWPMLVRTAIPTQPRSFQTMQHSSHLPMQQQLPAGSEVKPLVSRLLSRNVIEECIFAALCSSLTHCSASGHWTNSPTQTAIHCWFQVLSRGLLLST